MRTFLELHQQLLEIIGELEEEGKVGSINYIANRLGSSQESTMTHCKLAELHNRVTLLRKERGFVVMPSNMARNVKEE